MKHSITGLTGSTLPQQMLSSTRAHSGGSAKPTKPFQTIDPALSNSISQPQIPQAVTSLNPSDSLQSLNSNSILKQLDSQGAASLATNNFGKGMNRLQSSFASGEPAVPSTTSTKTSSPSLDPSVTQNLTSSGPGMVVNVLA